MVDEDLKSTLLRGLDLRIDKFCNPATSLGLGVDAKRYYVNFRSMVVDLG